MPTTYPGTIQTITDYAGTVTLANADHAGWHATQSDTIEAVETVLGTTAGTSVLKNFAAGDFAARINSSNVLQQAVSGTISGGLIGTTSITGGTISLSAGTLNNILMGTPTLNTPVVQNWDFWVDANESWSYLSGSVITMPNNASLKYQKGDKIKFTQGGTVKYAHIYGVGTTLATIIPNTDYVVENAAISANYYSRGLSPYGFPTFFNYSPSIGGTSTLVFSATASYASYRLFGIEMNLKTKFIGTTSGTANTTLYFTAPVPPIEESYQTLVVYDGGTIKDGLTRADVGSGTIVVQLIPAGNFGLGANTGILGSNVMIKI